MYSAAQQRQDQRVATINFNMLPPAESPEESVIDSSGPFEVWANKRGEKYGGHDKVDSLFHTRELAEAVHSSG